MKFSCSFLHHELNSSVKVYLMNLLYVAGLHVGFFSIESVKMCNRVRARPVFSVENCSSSRGFGVHSKILLFKEKLWLRMHNYM